MNKKIAAFGSIALVLSLFGFSALDAQAYKGDPNIKGPNYSTERHEAMQKAFASRDYDAWKALMQGRGRVTQMVNEDNFAKFAEAHDLALQGKTAEAKKIREELGLNLRSGMGWKKGVNR
jgi:hypothetical protein